MVKRLLVAGKAGADIPAPTGITLPSILAIRKSPGLVKERKRG